ncbi:hypothetical protein [Acinetobacter sp.]|uniref:hypothetical protein n=1 Tax=Acinetobacter sp. TaxID=472 RepID=UPI003D07D62C
MSTKLVKLEDVKDAPELSELLRNLPEEFVTSVTLDEKQISMLRAHAANDGTLGLKARLPIVCAGSECPFAKVCVYQKVGLAPVDYGCPEEMIIIEKLVPALVKDLQVDSENLVELDMIMEYVDAELQEIRAQKELAVRGQIEESVSTVDPASGTAYYERKESPSLNVKERAQRRKAQLRKDFLATREQRARYKLDKVEDESTRQAEKRKQYENLIKNNPERFTDVPFDEVPEHDKPNKEK